MLPLHQRMPQRRNSNLHMVLIAALSVGMVVQFGYWRGQVSTLTGNSSKLRKDLSQATEDYRKLQENLASQADGFRQVNAELGTVKQEKGKLEDEKKEREAARDVAETFADDLKQKFSSLEKQYSEQSMRLQVALSESASLKQQLSTALEKQGNKTSVPQASNTTVETQTTKPVTSSTPATTTAPLKVKGNSALNAPVETASVSAEKGSSAEEEGDAANARDLISPDEVKETSEGMDSNQGSAVGGQANAVGEDLETKFDQSRSVVRGVSAPNSSNGGKDLVVDLPVPIWKPDTVVDPAPLTGFGAREYANPAVEGMRKPISRDNSNELISQVTAISSELTKTINESSTTEEDKRIEMLAQA